MIPSHWKILITGVTSIHGWPIFSKLREIVKPGQALGIRPPKMGVPLGSDVQSVCITDESSFVKIRDNFSPTHVIHASGVCDLDVCEERPAWAKAMNVTGAEVIARVFGKGSYVLYLSTDLVFSGNNPPEGGYRETDVPDPVSVAGTTFATAEKIVAGLSNACILRLGLPLGESITGEKGAIDFIDRRLKRGLPLTLFHDELRSCISTDAITSAVLQFLLHGSNGLFHCGGEVPQSLYELGKLVLDKGGYPQNLLTTISRFDEKNGPPRMGNVSLNSGKLASLLNRFDDN
jgi:dTDP-4-dehydrorhamnose reductase